MEVNLNGAETISSIGLDNLKIPAKGNVEPSTETTPTDETKTTEELEKELEGKETKEEVKLEEKETETKTPANTDEDSVIAEFKSEFGEAEGEFEESTDGLKEYFKKITPKIEEEGKKKGITELFNKLPVVGQLAEHLAAGYGIESFLRKQEMIDYSKIEVKDDDLVIQEKLFRTALKVKGNDDEDIDSAIELAKDKGTLKTKADTSKAYLAQIQKEEIENQQKREKVITDKQAFDDAATLKQVDTILKSGNIAGIKLDSTAIAALRDFGTKQDKDGNFERDKKWDSLTIEQLLLLDHIVLNDFKPLGVKITPASTETKRLADLKKKTEKVEIVDLKSGQANNFKTNPGLLFQTQEN